MKNRKKLNSNSQEDSQEIINYKNDHELIDVFLKMIQQIFVEDEIHGVLDIAMDHLIKATGAERGMVILFNTNGEIIFEVARNLERQEIKHPQFEISRTIINKVKNDRLGIFEKNILEDKDISKSKSAIRLKILSIICIPMIYQNHLIGLIYLDNRTIRGAFYKNDFKIARMFSEQINLASVHALERKKLEDSRRIFEDELRVQHEFNQIIGHSPQMVNVLRIVSQVADTNAPVLIEGETGTGKELVARALHFNSQRKTMPLICINCGAIPENLLESELFGYEKGAFSGATKSHRGKFELAHKGTIFLDEIDEMSLRLQVKLLRLLQWGEVTPLGCESSKQCDVRVITAAKTKLSDLIKAGKFRDDLYYRINLIRIEMPALRERKDDILLLANYFLNLSMKKLNKSNMVLSKPVVRELQSYHFPGNVRELENIIHRVAILCKDEMIKVEHLPEELINTEFEDFSEERSSFSELKLKLIEDFERTYLLEKLQETNGNIRQAAKSAGIHERNFHKKLKKYGISFSKF